MEDLKLKENENCSFKAVLCSKKLIGMEFYLYHEKRKPKVLNIKVPEEPSFKDIFNHPCQKWFDLGYYIHCIIYIYS